MPYRIEVSPNNRAGCKGPKPCKGTKIPKGEIRFATRFKIQDKESWAYRHWGCVTEKIIRNVKEEVTDADDIDGFEELTPELQEKVRVAWQQGHVDPADIPESAKKVEVEGEEGEGGEDGEDSPKKKKAPAKKRAKKDEDDAEGDEEAKPKKKAAPKRKKAAEVDDEDEEKPKKKAASRKKAKKADSEDDEEEEVMPTKKAR